ncbi:ATP-binding cassette domain-containing protein [Geodermatophilus sp. SYSU D01176]
MAGIAVHHLTKRFGEVTAVDDLSVEVREGTITGFIGPNGAGKTTTLRAVLGLVRPTSGSATVGGKAYQELDRPAFIIGAALEPDGFHPGRTARNHLRILAHPNGIPFARVDEVLEEVDLTAAAHRRIGGFSLGMRQRLMLAGALLGDPPVLVLDEPANGLDPAGVHWLRALLRARADRGGTVLVSSHLLAELALSADHVVIIKNGRLITEGGVEEVTGTRGPAIRVRTPQAAALLAALTSLGIAATLRPPDEVVATGVSTRQVGEAVASAGLVVYEMRAEHQNLEEVFLELTEPEGKAS